MISAFSRFNAQMLTDFLPRVRQYPCPECGGKCAIVVNHELEGTHDGFNIFSVARKCDCGFRTDAFVNSFDEIRNDPHFLLTSYFDWHQHRFVMEEPSCRS